MENLRTTNYVSCAVPGCDDKNSSRHRFPNPEKDQHRFLEWIRLIKNEKLIKLSSTDPGKVYRNHRICHSHFTKDDILSNIYLKRTVLPSQRLPPSEGNKYYLLIYSSRYLFSFILEFHEEDKEENLEHLSLSEIALHPPTLVTGKSRNNRN